jgi:tRNA(Arg) A34 adenosine deaminase TadA
MHEGLDVRDCLLVTSYQPCFMCAKLIVAGGIRGVRYSERWIVPENESGLVGLTQNYVALWNQLPAGCLPLRANVDA